MHESVQQGSVWEEHILIFYHVYNILSIEGSSSLKEPGIVKGSLDVEPLN